MTKSKLAGAVTVGILALASAPAIADAAFGFEVDYILNPNGKEVPQTPPPNASAFGFDVWQVPGTFARDVAPASAPQIAAERAKDDAFAAEQSRHAFGLRQFGHQADA
jgi:hypothetical protein